LYLIKCILLIRDEDYLAEYNKGKFNLLFPIERVKLINKNILFLNPLLFLNPIFMIEMSKKNRNLKKKLIKKNRLTIAILNKMSPIAFMLSIIEFLIFPFSLIYQHMNLVIYSVAILYISLLILIVQNWVLRVKLDLSSKALRTLSIEYIFCPPFAINNIRNISILKLQEEGKLE